MENDKHFPFACGRFAALIIHTAMPSTVSAGHSFYPAAVNALLIIIGRLESFRREGEMVNSSLKSTS